MGGLGNAPSTRGAWSCCNGRMDQRPAIPKDLARRIYVEAGHRCAIPTCRHITVQIHHIVPWSFCKEHQYENLIALCPNCHDRADRKQIDAKSLLLYKFNLRLAHDKFSQLEMDVLFTLFAGRPKTILWLPVMHIFLNRLYAAGYIQSAPSSNNTATFGGLPMLPDMVGITEPGVKFVESFGLASLQGEDS